MLCWDSEWLWELLKLDKHILHYDMALGLLGSVSRMHNFIENGHHYYLNNSYIWVFGSQLVELLEELGDMALLE